jgi:hypothetical protein
MARYVDCMFTKRDAALGNGMAKSLCQWLSDRAMVELMSATGKVIYGKMRIKDRWQRKWDVPAVGHIPHAGDFRTKSPPLFL